MTSRSGPESASGASSVRSSILEKYPPVPPRRRTLAIVQWVVCIGPQNFGPSVRSGPRSSTTPPGRQGWAHGLGHPPPAPRTSGDAPEPDRLRTARRRARVPLRLGQRSRRLATRHRVEVPVHRRRLVRPADGHAVARSDRHAVLRGRLHRAAATRRHGADPRLSPAGADRQGRRLARRRVGRPGHPRRRGGLDARGVRGARDALRPPRQARRRTARAVPHPVHRVRPELPRRVLRRPGDRLRAQARQRDGADLGRRRQRSGVPAHGPLRRRPPRRVPTHRRRGRRRAAGRRAVRRGRPGSRRGPPLRAALPRPRGVDAGRQVDRRFVRADARHDRRSGRRSASTTSCSTRSPPAGSAGGGRRWSD